MAGERDGKYSLVQIRMPSDSANRIIGLKCTAQFDAESALKKGIDKRADTG